MHKNLIMDLSFDFSLLAIQYCEELKAQQHYVIAKQLLKSGTSIGANIREAQQAESKADFIHKLKIAAKEAAETAYWLDLCSHSKFYATPTELNRQITSIQKVLSRIIISAKKRS